MVAATISGAAARRRPRRARRRPAVPLRPGRRCSRRASRLNEPGHHHLVGLADLPHDRQGLRAQRPVPVAATLPAVQSGQPDQRRRARPGRAGRHRQGTLDPARALDEVAAEEPEPPQAGGEPQRGLRIVRAGPAQRRAQVVVLAVEQLGLFDDHSRGPFGVVGDGEGEEVRAVRGRQQLAPPPPVRGSRGRTAGPSPAAGTGTRRSSARRTTNDLSTSLASRSSSSVRSSGGPPQIASSAGSVKLPANTDSRRSRICSRSVSRSWLHSRVARSVWCRVTPTGPCPSTDRASPSRWTISAGSRTAILAAASSRASGIPSSRRHRSTTPWALSASSAKPGRTCAARSTNSRTDGELLQRGQVAGRSPGPAPAAPTTAPGRCTPPAPAAAPGWWPARRPRGIRPARARPAAHRPRAGARSCPARSARSRTAVGRRAPDRGSVRRPIPTRGPRTPRPPPATTRRRPRGRRTTRRPGTPDRTRSATCTASLVLPQPPAPVRVSRRARPISRSTSTSSRSRPMKLVNGVGR